MLFLQVFQEPSRSALKCHAHGHVWHKLTGHNPRQIQQFNSQLCHFQAVIMMRVNSSFSMRFMYQSNDNISYHIPRRTNGDKHWKNKLIYSVVFVCTSVCISLQLKIGEFEFYTVFLKLFTIQECKYCQVCF